MSARERPSGLVGAVVLGCDWLCRATMLVMMAVVAVEIVARNVLGLSMQLSDELGGYLLVAIGFLSLPVCQASGGFHQVTFVHDRLPPRGRAALTLVLEAMALAFVLILLWQLGRLELNSVLRGDQSDTLLEMPLWVPRLAMVVGMAALAMTVGHSLVAAWRRLVRG
jgi:TRAP-type C4-dicarboxylate transport system permease small subunit